jgi:two-component system CheB/CheR fusion protein
MQTTQNSSTETASAAPATPTHVVGLGASAGGLEALERFVSAIAVDSGMAYIVVQHMAPKHTTMLGTLLQRMTPLPVRQAVDDETLMPNTVYVIAPDSELTVKQGRLHVGHAQQPRGLRLPIDVLLSSLAQDLHRRAIGVVLSGMGADGTHGLQTIRVQGGLTLAQTPKSAQFDAMPSNAIASGCVDIVAEPNEMPRLIAQAARPIEPPGRKPEAPPAQADEPALATIISLLREHSKHDLSLYKTSTLLRRIERRVAAHSLASITAYVEFLTHNPQERDLLFAEMLIGVTSFFRDGAVWQELIDSVLPALLTRREQTPHLRAWIVGCSTGEEAYTLAMAFREVLDKRPDAANFTLQIFATDLSADAIAVARKGLYPNKSAEGLTPERMARFFNQQDGGIQVNAALRDMVLFAQHDVISDPPFTRLDLLSCRNVLIYFNGELQGRLMPLFHYSLKPGAVMVLGSSETVGRSQGLFTSLSPKARLYMRNELASHVGHVDFPINRHAWMRTHSHEQAMPDTSKPHPVNLQTLADQVLLQTISPPAVLINEGGDILYISGRTGKFLEPAAGKANWNVHVMAHPAIRTQLAVAIRQAVREGAPVDVRGIRLNEDAAHTLTLSIQPLREPKALAGMVMIVFRETFNPSAPLHSAPEAGLDPGLGHELENAREEIQALRQEMQASKEELQASNEALQSANEELQSANEELTTSKEEAQSMNEELQTINGELQAKLDDLALAQSDMQNLLNSTDIATLFLDNDLNVRRFTKQATRIFHLREADVGRPLSDLSNTLKYPELHQDAKDTVRTLSTCEKQISTTDGRWYTVRIMPYRTLSNMIQGAVMTFVDITMAKELEARLRQD